MPRHHHPFVSGLPSPVQFALLALVGSEKHGRDIGRAFTAQTKTPISRATLYQTLLRMRDFGWIEIRVDEANAQFRRYRITDEGRRSLDAARRQFRRLAGFGREGARTPRGPGAGRTSGRARPDGRES